MAENTNAIKLFESKSIRTAWDKEGATMSKTDPYTRDDQTRFTMRIDSDLLDRIKEQAEKNKRSTAKEIEFILSQHFEATSEE